MMLPTGSPLQPRDVHYSTFDLRAHFKHFDQLSISSKNRFCFDLEVDSEADALRALVKDPQKDKGKRITALIAQIFDRVLLPTGKCLAAFASKPDGDPFCTFDPEDSWFSISSPGRKLIVTAEQPKYLFASMKDLMTVMIENDLSEFHLPAQKSLVLTDCTPQLKADSFKQKGFSLFIDYIKKSMPEGHAFSFSDVSLSLGSYNQTPTLRVFSEKGTTFTLKPDTPSKAEQKKPVTEES